LKGLDRSLFAGPDWVKEAIDTWKEAAGITEGALFRSINKAGRVWEVPE